MKDPVDWYAEACLYRSPEVQGKKAVELFRGQLAQAIQVALDRPEEEQPNLVISCDTIDGELSWIKIAELSRRPDFPVMI